METNEAVELAAWLIVGEWIVGAAVAVAAAHGFRCWYRSFRERDKGAR